MSTLDSVKSQHYTHFSHISQLSLIKTHTKYVYFSCFFKIIKFSNEIPFPYLEKDLLKKIYMHFHNKTRNKRTKKK